MPTLDAPTLPALWCHHAGLGGPTPDSPRAVLARTGWVRTLGGIDAYVALRARCPTLTVADIHHAVSTRDIEVVPAARGCIYLVARDDAPLARAFARDASVRRMARERSKAGFGDDELERVCGAILDVLAEGPASTAQLRRLLPDGIVRSLGAAGKKVGLSSTLPPAVRVLEFDGRIVRRPAEDRLDHEQYVWQRTEAGEVSVDPRPTAERDADLIRRLLGWLGPSTEGRLATFTGMGKRAVRAALKGDDIHWHDTPDGPAAGLESAPKAPVSTGHAHFLPGLDTLLASCGGPAAFLSPADADRPASPWGRQKGDTWGTVQHILSRPIIVDGTIAGAWEVDPDTRSVVVQAFSPGLPAGIHAAASALSTFIWDGLGHGRAFAIDSDARIRKRRDLLLDAP